MSGRNLTKATDDLGIPANVLMGTIEKLQTSFDRKQEKYEQDISGIHKSITALETNYTHTSKDIEELKMRQDKLEKNVLSVEGLRKLGPYLVIIAGIIYGVVEKFQVSDMLSIQ